MRRVFTNAIDVIYLWAEKSQTDARSSNVFFEPSTYNIKKQRKNSIGEPYGDVIYSYGYHYELARFIDDKTVFINDEGYSVTTSKHISTVLEATRQYKQFYKTKCDLDLVHGQVRCNIEKLAKARKPETYVNEINRLFESLNEYLYYTRTKSKVSKSKKYREIETAAKSINNNLKDFRERLRIAALKKENVRKKKRKKEIKNFLNYKTDWVSRKGREKDVLRLSKDGFKVQTSQNAEVTIEAAKKLYLAIKAGKDVVGHKIDFYTVNAINKSLKIECHDIDMASVKEVGERLISS